MIAANDLCYEIVVTDPHESSGKRVLDFCQLLLHAIQPQYVVMADLDILVAISDPTYSYLELKRYEGVLLPTDDFLAKIQAVEDYIWAFFFFGHDAEFLAGIDYDLDTDLLKTIARTAYTVRVTDWGDIFVYTQDEKVYDTLKVHYPIKSLRHVDLLDLAIPS